ncbi:MAG: hypothetical protein AAB345_04240 [Patescibacteria group bacterium]
MKRLRGALTNLMVKLWFWSITRPGETNWVAIHRRIHRELDIQNVPVRFRFKILFSHTALYNWCDLLRSQTPK